MLQKIKSLLIELKAKNISYCHWKSTNHLEATFGGRTDIDVLFDKNESRKIESILYRLGFKRFETVQLRCYPGIHDFVCLDESGVWVHLHLHYILNLGDRWVKAYWFPIEKEVLSRAVYLNESNTFIVNPFDELMLHCLRMSLKFYSPFNKKNVFDELIYLKSKCKSAEPYEENSFNRLKWLKELNHYVLNSDELRISTLNKLSRKVSREFSLFRRFSGITFSFLSIKRKFYRYYIEFRRKIINNYTIGRRKIITGGKIIAFVGIDGCGKSTTLKYIEKFFAIQMNTTSAFLGNGKSGASWYRKIIFSIYGTKNKSQQKCHNINGKSSVNRTISTLYALWILICLFDKEKNLKKAIKAKANGSLVLSDRWPQQEVNRTFDGARINAENPKNRIVSYVKRREQKFLELATIVKPDLIIKLKISPETSLNRKPGELTLQEAQINSELLDKLSWNNNENIIEIDSNKSVEDVNYAVKQAIWTYI